MRYHNITKDDMLNGDGLRVVLWVSGCEHCCKDCQNPITWDPNAGLLFDDDAKQEIYQQLDKKYISGITFSGGDPLHPANAKEVKEFAAEIRQKYPDKTIWIYSGSTWEEVYQDPSMALFDVMVDGEFVKELLDNKLMWKGSSNQRVINIKSTLASDNPAVPILHCENYSAHSKEAREGQKVACCGN
ncbi:MAG: anaerobic ribonucleoside-triphosphate reductase activating protein [Lachnospiraceae bacterium]|nr:anaerobic ribonucleoside-triphosphate reductase activating protein [Candidatus Merdinaster equi]